MDSEQQIVERVVQGDGAAFEILFERHADSVRSMLVARTGGDESLADDLAQEAFIRAYIHIEQFNPDYNFGQWIFGIARNLHTDHIRRQRAAATQIDDQTPSTDPSPEQRIINTQNAGEFRRVIESMPPHLRTVFELRYLEDLSYEEIALRTRQPIGTVKTHLYRARERFFRSSK